MKRQKIQLLLSLLPGAVSAIWCYRLYSMFEPRWNYLVWDPAAHGWDGIRLALDIRNFQLLQLLGHTNQLVLWPPLHSYLQIPYFFAFGYDFQSAVLCSLTFLALFPIALTYFYQQLNLSWAGWIALMGFALTSPMILSYGSMPMLEIFGAVIAPVAAALFLRKSRWFPLSLALLFFLKYNYFLYVLLPVLILHCSKTNLVRLRQIARDIKPLIIIIIGFLILAVLILITGGTDVGPVSVRGIGNPAYGLFLFIVLWILWKRKHIPLWHAIRRTGWHWFVIPVFIWLLIPVPNRVKTILSFAINRPLGSPSPATLDYYLYYFETFPLYFSDRTIAWIAFAIMIGIVVYHRKKRPVLFTGALFVLPFLLMTLNQNKQDRFLFTFIPFVWVAVAYAITRIRGISLRLAATIALTATLAVTFNPDLVRVLLARQFAPTWTRPASNFIARRVAGASEIRVLGATNELNPAMIQFHAGAHNDFSSTQRFEWSIEKAPESGLDIICINCETPGRLLRSRTFKQEVTVRHYFLDTPDGAPYNPIQ